MEIPPLYQIRPFRASSYHVLCHMPDSSQEPRVGERSYGFLSAERAGFLKASVEHDTRSIFWPGTFMKYRHETPT